MGQDKREIPRQAMLQTPEKQGSSNDNLMGIHSGPSPTGEKLSQILNGGGQGSFTDGSRGNSRDKQPVNFDLNSQGRAGSTGSRGVNQNMSMGSIGSMNLSTQGAGYQSDGAASAKSGVGVK